MWRSNLSFTLLLLSTITTTTTAKILYANTSSELTSALKKAKPGDVVTLLPVDYVGDFVLPDHTDKDNATSNDATTLLGTQSEDFQRHSTIISSTGTGISITAHRRPWNVKSLVIQSNDTGVKIRGNNHVIQSVVIRASKVAAVIKGDNIVLNSTVISNGEKGVILGGNDNVVKSVALNGLSKSGIVVQTGSAGTQIRSVSTQMLTGNSLILQNGTKGTNVHSTTFNAIANLDGDDGKFASCVFTGVNLSGCRNKFSATVIQNLYEETSDDNSTNCNNIFEKTCVIGNESNDPLD
ncbi:uncharacterized protein LOC110861520 [Folsomia candida]|nr:uncharacterized protein LOC110861520 [Folsomia candida]